jgi:hypothetical protein
VGTDEDRASFGYFVQAVYRYQALLLQAAQFGVVVYDGAQGIQAGSLREGIFGLCNGADHSSAEAGTGIYLYA